MSCSLTGRVVSCSFSTQRSREPLAHKCSAPWLRHSGPLPLAQSRLPCGSPPCARGTGHQRPAGHRCERRTWLLAPCLFSFGFLLLVWPPHLSHFLFPKDFLLPDPSPSPRCFALYVYSAEDSSLRQAARALIRGKSLALPLISMHPQASN